MDLHTVLLWLFILNLGVAFGAGIYEARVVVPLWEKNFPHGFTEIETGRRFWGFVTTVPLTCLCIASLVVAYRGDGLARGPWLISAMIVLAERLLTFGYFIPTIVRLQKSERSPENLKRFALWKNINVLRNGMTLAAWILALRALSVSAA
jgi:hypothetical protein